MKRFLANLLGFGKQASRTIRYKKRFRRRPELEQLEDRLAPAFFTWTGANSTLWSDPGNWGENQAPTAVDEFLDDVLFFPTSGVVNFTSVNDIGIVAASQIRIAGNGYTITGGTIQLNTNAPSVPGLRVQGNSNTLSSNLELLNTLQETGFEVTSTNVFLLTGTISEEGGFDKEGTGTLVLTADNTYTGTTTISAGVLQVGNGGATGTLGTGAITVNASLIFNRSTALTVANNISGNSSGSLTKNNTNTVTLSGDSIEINNTDIAAGVLNVRQDATLGNTIVRTGAALEVQGTITVTTSGLTLNGTGPTVNGALLNVSGNNTVAGAVTLGSASSIGSSAGTLTVTANINNAGFLLTATGAGSTVFSGVLSGAGGLTKNGTGTLTLSGTGVNTYAGVTTVAQGVVNIRKASALGAIAAGTTVANGAALQVQGGVAFNAEPLTVNGSGITGTGALRNVSGNNTWSATITLGSASSIGSSAGTLTVTANINNAGFLLTATGAASTLFSGVLSGAGGLTKNGTGTLTMSGAGVNTYAGVTTVSQGAVNIRKASALGAIAAGTTVANGAALQVQGGVAFNAEPLTLNGSGISGTGALLNVSGNNTLQGNITLGSASRIGSTAGTLTVAGNINNAGFLLTGTGAGNTTFNGVLSGAGGLDKSGAGTLTLAGTLANTFTGSTRIGLGLLVFNKPAGVNAIAGNLIMGIIAAPAIVRLLADNQIPDAVAVTFNSAGVLDLNGRSETIGPLNMTGGRIITGTGLLTLSGAVTATSASNSFLANPATIEGNLSLGGTTRTFTINDGPQDVDMLISAVISSGTQTSAGLVKAGAGRMILAANNTYTGATTVNGGTLVVNGIQGTSAAVVNTGGTLAGTGTVGTLTVNGGGTVRPGAGQSLSVTGNATFANNTATYSADLIATSIGQLGATGTLTLNNATLRLLDVNIPNQPGLLPPLGAALPILSAASITGTFNGLPNNAIVVSSSGLSYRVNYTPNIVFVIRVSGPAFQERAITSPIDEGGVATLTGNITTILPDDTFFLEVNWGDGSRTETFTFQPGAPRDVLLEHRYLDDGIYNVELLWRDQRGAFNTDTLAITVTNVAPQVFAGSDASLRPSNNLVRQGFFVDPGADTWTATVDYGDGSGLHLLRVHGDSFLLRHRYEQPDTYTVTITVLDDDGDAGTSSFTVVAAPHGKSPHAS